MPRLVIHEHTREGRVHYDLMLESPQRLWTWRFDAFPGNAREQSCQRIQDHDAKYLAYEGELSPGNGRVRIVESGTFDLLSAREDEVHFTARGRTVAGAYRLVRKNENDWALLCESGA